jgi:hypothetical protein
MSDEYRIRLTARNEAIDAVESLKRNISGLRETLLALLNTSGAGAADAIRRINTEITSATTQMNALRAQFNIALPEELSAINKITRAFETQNTIRQNSTSIVRQQATAEAELLAARLKSAQSFAAGQAGLADVAKGSARLRMEQEFAAERAKLEQNQMRDAALYYAQVKANEAVQRESVASIQAAATAHAQLSKGVKDTGDNFAFAQREAKHFVALFDEFKSGRFSQMFSTFGSMLRDTGAGASTLISGLVGLAGIAIGAAVARDLTKWGEELGKLAERQENVAAAVGISVPQYIAFSGALRLTGGSAETAARTLETLQRRMQEAVMAPQGPAMSAFRDMGLTWDEMLKRLRDPQGAMQTLMDISDYIVRIGGDAERTSRIMEAFGGRQQFMEIMSAIKGGSQNFRELMSASESLNPFMTANHDALVSINKDINELSVAWEGFKASVTSGEYFRNWIQGLELLIVMLDRAGEAAVKVPDAIQRRMDQGNAWRYADPYGSGAVNIPSATASESAILAQVRQREGGGRYDTFHATGQTVSSLEEIEALKGFKSHAFGAYGFQPGTYREMGAITGKYDISPASQDVNALALLRKYGPNASQSWAKSGPYDTSGVVQGTGAATAVPGAPSTSGEMSPFDLGASEKAYEAELRLRKLVAEERHDYEALNRLREKETEFASMSADQKEAFLKVNVVNSQNVALGKVEADQRVAIIKTVEDGVRLKQQEFNYTQQSTMAQLQQREAAARARDDLAEIVNIRKEELAIIQADPYKSAAEKIAAQTRLQQAQNDVLKEQVRLNQESYAGQSKAAADILRGFEADIQKRPGISKVDAYKYDIQEVERLNGALSEVLKKEMDAADAVYGIADATKGSVEQTRIWWQQWDLGIKKTTEVEQLLEKMRTAQEAITKKWAEPWTKAFDSVASALENAITGVLSKKTTWKQAEGQVATAIGEGLLKAFASTASKALAKTLFDNTAGEGLDKVFGDLISKGVGKLFDVGTETATKTSAEVAGATAGAPILSAGIVAGAVEAAPILSAAMAAGGAGGGGASAIGEAATLALAFAEKGMVVPSFASGGLTGGSLSILHPREMVLPEHLSTGMQNMINSGNAGGSSPEVHMHFHGPADGPSIDRWFKGIISNNSNVFRDMFRANSLRSMAY